MCVCVCVYIYIYILLKVQRENKNIFKLEGPLRDLPFFFYLFIYFALTYAYVSSLLLLSENIYGTRPC